MRKKVIVWAIPALFGVALLRSLFAADPEPTEVAQVPNLFNEPVEVGREPLGTPALAGEADPDEYQPRSRHVRSMYAILDGLQEGAVEGEGITDEQRRFIRRELMLADEELADSMGPNLLRAILRANNPRNTFSVGSPTAQQPMRRLEVEELHRLRNNDSLPRVRPTAPGEETPPPADPAPAVPADPFGD